MKHFQREYLKWKRILARETTKLKAQLEESSSEEENGDQDMLADEDGAMLD